jgi:AcrR family transcriptional regulator
VYEAVLDFMAGGCGEPYSGVMNDRDKLIGAARALLMEDGYSAVTRPAAAARATVEPSAALSAFASDADLVLAALEAHWAEVKAFFEDAFHRRQPPLERLRRFFEGTQVVQDGAWSKAGCVVGCLLLQTGSSVPRSETKLRARTAECFAEFQGYVESALRDAQDQGLIRRGDVPTMAWTLIHYVEGALGMARIQNDMKSLKGMMERSLEFLGATPEALAR